MRNAEDRSEDLLTTAEVAAQYGVSALTIRRWVKAGRLPAVRLAGLHSLRYRRADVDALAVPVFPGPQDGEAIEVAR